MHNKLIYKDQTAKLFVSGASVISLVVVSLPLGKIDIGYQMIVSGAYLGSITFGE